MDDKKDGWTFWRDDAELSVLSPEHRAKALLALLGTIVAISGLLYFSKWRPLGMDEATVQIAYFLALALILPSLLALEMFYKGGNAAAKLKGTHHVAKEKQADEQKKSMEKLKEDWTDREAKFNSLIQRRDGEIQQKDERIRALEAALDERIKKRELIRLLQDKLVACTALIDQKVDWNSPCDETEFRAAVDEWHDDVCDILNGADCLPGAFGIFRSIAASEAQEEFEHLCRHFGGNTNVARLKAAIHAHRAKLMQIVRDYAE